MKNMGLKLYVLEMLNNGEKVDVSGYTFILVRKYVYVEHYFYAISLILSHAC